jgi:hypothetical protein
MGLKKIFRESVYFGSICPNLFVTVRMMLGCMVVISVVFRVALAVEDEVLDF